MVVVSNVWSQEKEEYLKFNLKNKYIQDVTSSECADLGHRFSFQSIKADPAFSTKEQLMRCAHEQKSDIICVGFHGRKGLKADPTVMGTAVQYLSVESFCPVLIVKDAKTRETSPEGCFRYAACIDGSIRSMELIKMIT